MKPTPEMIEAHFDLLWRHGIDRESAAAALTAALAVMWKPIETAPKDGTLFLAWAPSVNGLPAMYSLCAWHPDGGFCIDELREATKWQPLPDPPKETA